MVTVTTNIAATTSGSHSNSTALTLEVLVVYSHKYTHK